jgi:hypothetical protein
MRTVGPFSRRRRKQEGVASRFFLLLAVVLISIATPLTASLAAAETDCGSSTADKTYWQRTQRHLKDAKRVDNANILRFQAHALFQFLAFFLSAIAAIHMFWGAFVLGVFGGLKIGGLDRSKTQNQYIYKRNIFSGLKYWTLVGPEKERKTQLIKWFMRSFNLFIVAEVIASLSTSLNPSWEAIGVLVAVVVVRALLSVVLIYEEKNAPEESA